jgi:hypothetical protein
MTSVPKDDVICSNTETLAELSSGNARLLQGFSKFFIARKIEKNPHFNQSEIISLRPGVFARPRIRKTSSLIPTLHNPNYLTLVPRRDITQIRGNPSRVSSSDSRRYILVLVDSAKGDFLRRTLSRIMQRTPMIRIRPGVILLPQVRTKRVRFYTPTLYRPSEFLSRIVELGIPVSYAPRLELVGSTALDIVSELIVANLEKRTQRIVDKCRVHYSQLRTSNERQINLQDVKKDIMRLRLQQRYLRKQIQFFRNEFGIDCSNLVNRAGSVISRVNQRMKICDK